ncbi:MAG: flagellar biosynthesis protein FlhB [Phycisphaeraceae bacterium]|nr:flagellar biosynthesis protein FlhB [Phycisphaerales bacterium]MCB9861672.1 flagellar biosynthesis protein FlhB [Phycisphaeraceae bacterium]
MAEDMGERTEDPTAHKLSDARKKGQIARSQDLGGAIALILATVAVIVFGKHAMAELSLVTRRLLDIPTADQGKLTELVRTESSWTGARAAIIALPFMGLMALGAYLSQVLQVGLIITGKPLEPKLDKLSPIKGFQRIFGLRGVVKGAAGVAKLVAVAGVTTLFFFARYRKIAGLPALELLSGMYATGVLILELVAWILVLLFVLGIADYLFQRWQHSRDLRMTKQEVRDERRSMEGDPDVKARRQRMAREIALQRIQQEVPNADVIVTNPTHFSVALKYDRATMHAPRVTAKGADLLAWRIRHVAMATGVPIVERPPLARALYHSIEVGEEIHEEHYEAVAEILAYVYRLDRKTATAA